MTTYPRVRIGISPCPNDTFAFCALVNGWVDRRGLSYDFELHDVEVLNGMLREKRLDVGKASFHAALRLSDDYLVLPSGSALGFGVGPLLLSADEGSQLIESSRVLVPGAWTTATLLLQLLYPNVSRLENVLFSEIMPSLRDGDGEFGVVIHEGRFTYQSYGLHLVEDLGSRWEHETQGPLPLGGILGSRELAPAVLRKVQDSLRDSIEFAQRHPERTVPFMRQHATELDDDVIQNHVSLYVNEQTLDLGQMGRKALECLATRATETGLIKRSSPLQVLE